MSHEASPRPADPPTLYEWMGGEEALERLMAEFYKTVREDDVLRPLFQHMVEDHPHHVAMWFGEVFGGPPGHSEERGGIVRVRRSHRGKSITPEQRRRWVALMMQAADTVGLPGDSEFRSAFAAYVEWGSQRAMRNSQPGAEQTTREETPFWGWGQTPPGMR